MKINETDTFNEKCDKVLIYLADISKSDKNVTPLTHLNNVSKDLEISINDPVIHFLSHEKNFVFIDRKTAFSSITSSGFAFISHSSFVKEQLKSETEGILKWYETENAKQIFDDYAKVKSRTIRNEWIAIFAAAVAMLGLILQWINNKND